MVKIKKKSVKSFFSSPDPKGHVSYSHHLSVEQWLQQYRTLSFGIYCGFMYDRGEIR
jgi:hypothetical protein